MRPRRELEESVLQGVVAEERRVQIVGNDTIGRLLRCAVAHEEAVLRELFWRRLGYGLDRFRTVRAAAGQGHREEHAAKKGDSSLEGSHSSAHQCAHSLHPLD